MDLIRTKALFLEACRHSPDLHVMTDEERTMLQKHLLSMYKEIEAVCDKHDLTVMLGYGSVLGAVRHGGFIPWDDDMDLYMPRMDYELLIHEYADELPEHLKIYAPNNGGTTIGRFAKVVDTKTKFIPVGSKDIDKPSQGIFVDIFPLEGIKKGRLRNKINRYISMALMYIGSSVGQYQSNSRHYRQLMSYSTPSKVNYWLRHTLGFLFSFCGYQKWMDIIDNFCKNDQETGFVDDLLGEYKWKAIPQNIFFPPVKGKFEGESVYLPHDLDRYLELTFGNWRRIPPVEERDEHFIRLLKI